MPAVTGRLREALELDRSRLAPATALPGAVGFTLPLAIGLGVGEVADGLAASIGALIVGFANLGGPYRVRAATLLAASVATAVAALVGGLSGSSAVAAALVAGVWGFGGALLVALGRRPAFVGLLSTWALLLAADLHLDDAGVVREAWLIAAGGLLQTALAVALWPLRPTGPERAAVAAAYRSLAAYARDPSPAAMEAAGVSLAEAGIACAEAADRRERALVEQGEWIRLEIAALARAGTGGWRRQLRDAADVAASERADEGEVRGLLAGADATSARAGAGDAGRLLADAAGALDQIASEQAVDVERLRLAIACADVVPGSDAHRASDALVTWIAAAGERRGGGVAVPVAPAARLSRTLDLLRAELTLRSSAFRHAARLAVALVVAVVVYRELGLGFGYWVPVTVLFVLKPDYGTTFQRGIGRAAGTMLGVVVAAAFVSALSPSETSIVLILAALAFAAYLLFPAGYASFSVVLTVLVALMTEIAGGSALGAVEDRFVDTAVGASIALAAFAVWPTREAERVDESIAVLHAAQARWLGGVLAAYDGGAYDRQALSADRLSARRARSDAVAAVERAIAEPPSRRPDAAPLRGVIATMDDLSESGLALVSAVHDGVRATDAPAGVAAEARRVRAGVERLSR